MKRLVWLPFAWLCAAQPDPLLEDARANALRFTNELPSFLCRQTTLRENRPAQGKDWKLTDILSAEVAFEGGREEYRWTLHNGVPVDDLRAVSGFGTTSRGEWGTMLLGVFHPDRRTAFAPSEPFTRDGFKGRVFRFSVERANSNWMLGLNQTQTPTAYSGSVYIDEKLRRAVRIEAQTRDLPASFPLVGVNVVLEFGLVRIQDESHLLPVRSVNELCARIDNRCNRNTIDFFGHRKFQAVSRLVGPDAETLTAQRDPVLLRVLETAKRQMADASGKKYYRSYYQGESVVGRNWNPTGVRNEQIVIKKGSEQSAVKDSRQVPAWTQYLESLTELFDPVVQAEFSDGGTYLLEPVPVHIYFFRVPAERSHLKIQHEGRSVAAAYSGALLVETGTARVHTFSWRTQALPMLLPVFQVQKAVLFQPDPQNYRKDSAPALVADLFFWKDATTADRYETHYSLRPEP